MNKNEAIKAIEQDKIQVGRFTEITREVNAIQRKIEMVDYVPLETVVSMIDKINESQKPKVSRVAVEFYEKYKGEISSLDEWFSDFYSKEAIEDFPRMEELTEWLHGNDNETNRRRELALATLVTLGIDAVEIEQEKLYTVEIPNPNSKGNHKIYLCKDDTTGKVYLCKGTFNPKKNKNLKLTKAEIRKDFEWAWQWAKEVL